ncbi:hemin uptake protein HemP [Hoeflea olei]|uniref:Hemin transporter HemP n=1 Tax=Hoeflea olei TaxID=1480615 RepID=A0A1C1YTX7_9HYPH|nr:hemin uptake protein HemP [Hoeflea olei]OCW56962.1 hypothetical protein AWJ14_07345 [Hoeflea olei]
MTTTKTHTPEHAKPSLAAPPVSAETAHAPQLPVFDTRNLFGAASEIGIVHQGSLYRLKITRQGKLILNK